MRGAGEADEPVVGGEEPAESALQSREESLLERISVRVESFAVEIADD